ncbi:hypothetical protein SeMB42_g03950 [Synchytrium endobioticum]|uniref:Rhomboid-type serine protease n=1 Tax=Synchytrium endobioticum TaxID=286115 RepID=A0A507D5U1_9FUNG|nr:hypothetical protein SeMB42_g03950 [Synchytrium endobioticum]TPX46882.1 hypothetical protein SeLEV6574_g02975 [Synchytrium endobioticum]
MDSRTLSKGSAATLTSLIPPLDNDFDSLVNIPAKLIGRQPSHHLGLPSSTSLSSLLAGDESRDIDDMIAIPRLIKSLPVKSKGLTKFANFLIMMDQERYRSVQPLVPIAKARHFSRFLLVVHTALLIAMLVFNRGMAPLSVNPLFGPSPQTLQTFGANVASVFYIPPTPATVASNLYRLVTAMFLHSGIVHLLVISMCEITVGRNMIHFLGYTPLVSIWMLAGIGGNAVAVGIRSQLTAVSVGSSGALMGLHGANIADILMNWKEMRQVRGRMLYWVVNSLLVLLLSLMPYVDNLVHVGGFITGFGAGLLCIPFLNKETNRVQWYLFKIFGFALSFVVIYLSIVLLLSNIYVSQRVPWFCHALLSISC